MFSFVIFTVFLFVTWILFDFGIGVCQNLQSARGAETRCIYDHGRRRKKRGEKSLAAHLQELSLCWLGWMLFAALTGWSSFHKPALWEKEYAFVQEKF